MAQSFIECDREQAFLMPPDVRDWLAEGHLAWFVLDAVAAMDLAAFYAAYREDGRSRPAYEPSMMVALLLYAYCQRSSVSPQRRPSVLPGGGHVCSPLVAIGSPQRGVARRRRGA
jgi:hypothetical protein